MNVFRQPFFIVYVLFYAHASTILRIDYIMEYSMDNNQDLHPGCTIRLLDLLRYHRARKTIRFSPVWQDITAFASCFENEVAPELQKKHQDILRVRIPSESRINIVGLEHPRFHKNIVRFARMWQFFLKLGIKEIELDRRLEQNQIEDILILLYTCSNRLMNRKKIGDGKSICSTLLSNHGLIFACTQTKIDSAKLCVKYSYCITRFSRIVRWFKGIQKDFKDHRALFNAAPRYAMLSALIASVPVIISLFSDNHLLLFGISLAGITILFTMVYIGFMIIGSVEYDNEEKSYQIEQAYDKLKIYTDRIQDDIARARIVQEKLLPNLDDIPLSDKIEWASSFNPEIEVGGDYFDIGQIDKDKLAILFADVSGHGMAAALVTAILKTSFQAWLEEKGTISDLLRKLNHNLHTLTPDESFAAVFVASCDANTGKLEYLNGGHNPEPWIIPSDKNKDITPLNDARCLLLGVDDEIKISTSNTSLQSGDKVLFVSDGLTEAFNLDRDMYGTEKFEDLIRLHRDESPQELVKSIVEEIDDFTRETEQTDDRTVLCFRIEPHSTLPVSSFNI